MLFKRATSGVDMVVVEFLVVSFGLLEFPRPMGIGMTLPDRLREHSAPHAEL